MAGLAVPGMPVGSPGMEGANPQSYEVIIFDKQAVLQYTREDKRA